MKFITDVIGWLGLLRSLIWMLMLQPAFTEFVLSIAHTNDVHARFDEFSKFGSECREEDSENGKCFGGVARRVTAVGQLRELYPNILLLDAGDQFQGTLWFYVHRGKAASHFMNLLQYDAMALGNHEFDTGIDGLQSFLQNATFPVLSANIDSTAEPSVESLFAPYTIKTVNGEKIGIIGYTTKDTPDLSKPGKLVFKDEVASIRLGVETLRSRGVSKVIALGHAGYKIDQAIAKVEGVDVVVGGHTNTFLFNGVPPSLENPIGGYPKVVNQEGGGQALVVQDYAFGKYLGVLHVTFDDDGNVVSWEGNPWVMNGSVAQDEDTLTEMKRWKEPLDRSFSVVVGTSHVRLDGLRSSCRLGECNLGNFVTDGMISWHLKFPDEKFWSDVVLAIHNGGGIRSSIPQGPITLKDVYNVHPFSNTIDLVEIEGRYLREVFEFSVWDFDSEVQRGRFLQVSGFRVVYDISKPNGRRVVKLDARCSECDIPRYEPLVDDRVYKLAVPSFIVAGGDGYEVFKKHMLKHHIYGDLDVDILLRYVKSQTPIIAGLEDRITFVDATTQGPVVFGMCSGCQGGPQQYLIALVLALFMAIFVS